MCGLPASGPRRRACRTFASMELNTYVLRARALRAPRTHVQYSWKGLDLLFRSGPFPIM
ncbi:unnamed protein product [Staurois parvus]|uniref:Uncharacterized protein n=1 Tax=Staurois parvus TaxID=386267 RepID=A0ABN9E9I4_9NEOB|nr:unnamed protein product [Staurois parvus]